jgi:uncharacterized membrane protein HdeD (DUF308 family)
LKTANLEFLAGTIQERKSKVGRQVFAVPILGSSGLARKSQWFATRRAGTARANRGAFLGLRQESVMATRAKAPRDPDTWGDIDTPLMHRILEDNWWVIALRGILGILFGLIALFFPGVTILSLVLLFSAYMLVDGAFSIAGVIRYGQRNERWGWMLLNGILSILTAVVAFLWPGLTAVVFVLILAAWSIVSGVLMLTAAYRMKSGARARGWLIFSGIVSLLFGALLVLSPLMGAVVLTWWLGAYVLVSSVIMLVLAFAVRSRTSRPGGSEGPRTAAP